MQPPRPEAQGPFDARPRWLRQFPRPCPLPGLPSTVLHGRAREIEYAEHDGLLSVKCVFAGSEYHRAGLALYRVEPGSYLVLNEGRRYSSWIETREPSEILSVFFTPGFADDVLRTLSLSADRLVDEPERRVPAGGFVERLYRSDRHVTPVLERLRAVAPRGEPDRLWIEERLHELFVALVRAQRCIGAEIASLPAVRPATREELYRRLHRARDFLHSSTEQPLTLARLAEVACLSPHHFLRLFRAAFGTTPHRYLVELRLEATERLLHDTDLSVTAICAAVGFESLGSFSRLFKARRGVSPSRFRASRRIGHRTARQRIAISEKHGRGPRR